MYYICYIYYIFYIYIYIYRKKYVTMRYLPHLYLVGPIVIQIHAATTELSCRSMRCA